jgi:hypothetical protein
VPVLVPTADYRLCSKCRHTVRVVADDWVHLSGLQCPQGSSQGTLCRPKPRSCATLAVGGQAPISSVAGLFGGRGAASPDEIAKARTPVSAAAMMRMSASVAPGGSVDHDR